ncbi:MAG: PPC domain-containing protein [Anaerolineae bacterium]|nr:PPC domain-containing protein [Anaerolineae bacterium]
MVLHRTTRFVALAVIAALVVALLPALSTVESAGGVLSYGDVVSGQINNKTYFELWEFTGNKGDRVRIYMEGDAALDAYLGLIEMATEQVLVEDDDSGGNSNALIETTLPASGSFVIIATRYDFDQGTSQGTYALELTGGKGPQDNTNVVAADQPVELQPGVYYMGDIAMAEAQPGVIEKNAFAQLYSIELEKGTDLFVGMFADASNLDSFLMFATEEGDVLAEDDDSGAQVSGGGNTDAALSLTVPATGIYYVIATRAGMENGMSTGAYVLFAGVPEEAEPEPQQAENDLPPGVDVMGDIMLDAGAAQGAITNDSFAHLYLFDGNAGETVTITMSGEGNLDAYLGLIDPNDEVIAEDDDSGGGASGVDAQLSLRLPETGTYIIIATRNGLDEGTTTGNYTLQVTSGQPEAPDDAVGIGGFGGLPGRSFESGEGDTFYLRGSGASKNPDKASPLENYLYPPQGDLPGRSFKTESQSFYLSGFGKSNDPAKSTPIEQLLGK